jgi:hypothetical protein
MGWWKWDRKAEPVDEAVPDRMLVDRLVRIAAAASVHETPPPPPPPVILLLEAPNHRREFISRFPWTGGISPFNPIDEVKRRIPRDQRELNWWERPDPRYRR